MRVETAEDVRLTSVEQPRTYNIGGHCMGRQTSTIMEETEACDDLPQSGGDGVAKPDDNDPRPPQLAGDGDAGGPRDDDGPESPETAGGGEPVGQCGGVGREAARPPQQTKRPADGLGGSHHGSHEDEDVEVSTTASSDEEVPVGGGSNFQPGPLSEDHDSDKRGESTFLPFGSGLFGIKMHQARGCLILELWVFEN